MQLVDSVTPNGQWFGTGVADSQSALILSPGVDRVFLPTSSDNASSASMARPGNTETASQANRQVLNDALPLFDALELVGVEGGGETPIAILGNSPLNGETSHIISAYVAPIGAPSFQPSMAIPPVGLMFQVGILPQLNTLLFWNGPGDQEVERLFQALARNSNVDANSGNGPLALSASASFSTPLPGGLDVEFTPGTEVSSEHGADEAAD